MQIQCGGRHGYSEVTNHLIDVSPPLPGYGRRLQCNDRTANADTMGLVRRSGDTGGAAAAPVHVIRRREGITVHAAAPIEAVFDVGRGTEGWGRDKWTIGQRPRGSRRSADWCGDGRKGTVMETTRGA